MILHGIVAWLGWTTREIGKAKATALPLSYTAACAAVVGLEPTTNVVIEGSLSIACAVLWI